MQLLVLPAPYFFTRFLHKVRVPAYNPPGHATDVHEITAVGRRFFNSFDCTETWSSVFSRYCAVWSQYLIFGHYSTSQQENLVDYCHSVAFKNRGENVLIRYLFWNPRQYAPCVGSTLQPCFLVWWKIAWNWEWAMEQFPPVPRSLCALRLRGLLAAFSQGAGPNKSLLTWTVLCVDLGSTVLKNQYKRIQEWCSFLPPSSQGLFQSILNPCLVSGVVKYAGNCSVYKAHRGPYMRSYSWLASDVIAAMLVDDNKRFLITSIVSSTNMAATSLLFILERLIASQEGVYFLSNLFSKFVFLF